ncbi:heparinase II/III domain-containing protein [Paenibacillus cremeus]|uniref:Coagulation factor 5/8 type domain-containing protein n=1 Tax=Paenibacillus cremeus TaxID=2163881 RepID=A0A559K6K1_9BACL|nr:heparinase II/III family protein [Paenibacillus cremeus]TVY07751.1 coagulation factor 5/8 type domain-containing protein [Paenibacillus cremeus]
MSEKDYNTRTNVQKRLTRLLLLTLTTSLAFMGASCQQSAATATQSTAEVAPQVKEQPSDTRTAIENLKITSPDKLHPRLMATSKDFERIKQLIGTDPQAKAWYKTLQTAAGKTLKEPVVKYELPDGVRLLPISRKVLERTIQLSLMYKLTGEKAYLDRAWGELSTVSDPALFPDWHPIHFLDTAEMTMAAAVGYDWLYSDLSEDQRNTLRTAIMENGLKPALSVYRGKADAKKIATFWKTTTNNWNSVVNGGIGVGALAIADESPETEALSGEILQQAVQSIKSSLKMYAPDGGMPEGPGYWDYATVYIAYFLSSLDSAIGTDYGLSQMPGLSETGYFPLYVEGAGQAFNLGDGGTGTISKAPQLLWYADKFHKPELTYGVKNGSNPMNLIWYKPATVKSPTEAGAPLDKRYVDPETEFVTMRSSWNANDAMFVGLHTGDNEANHGDLDAGDMVLDAMGVRWAMELGSDDYNLPGYFDMNKGRWNYYRKRAEGQNTLVLNPGSGPDQSPKAKTSIESFISEPNRAITIANLTNAYAKDATSVKRGIELQRATQSVLLRDEIQLKSPGGIWWFWHTQAQVEVSSDGKTAILSRSGKKLALRLPPDDEAQFKLMNAESLPTSPNPPKQAVNKGIQKLAIHLEGVEQTAITVQIDLMRGSEEQLPPLEAAKPLSDWPKR